jgi:hypothetical protein
MHLYFINLSGELWELCVWPHTRAFVSPGLRQNRASKLKDTFNDRILVKPAAARQAKRAKKNSKKLGL